MTITRRAAKRHVRCVGAVVALCHLAFLPACDPGTHAISIVNSSSEPMTVEIIRVARNGLDRSWADLPAGAQTTSMRMRDGDPLLLAEARLRLAPGPTTDPCYVFELPTSGMFSYQATLDAGHISLTETSRFDALSKTTTVPAR